MSDGLKEKLGNFIQSIKSKLPGKSDEDDYDDEENEEEFDEKTEEIDLKNKLKSDDDEDDDDEEDDDEVAAAAKKKQTIIRGLIVLICLYLAYDTFMVTPEVPVEAPVVKRKKRKKRKKKSMVNKVANSAKKKKEVTKDLDPVAKVEAVEAVEPVAKVEPVAEIIEPKEDIKVDEPQKAEVYEPLTTVGEVDFSSDPIKPEPMKKENSLGEMGQVKKKEDVNLDNSLDNLSDSTPKMIEKFKKEKTEYTEPPTYQETGKGLVYNCTGKHWACVDKPSYLSCKKNTDWSKENKKMPECYASDVYQSFNDCRVIQVDRINTLASTSFCK